MKKKVTLELSRGTVCALCKHVYIFPCDGKRYDCANAVWVRSKGTIDIGKLSLVEQEKIAKTGKLPDINTQAKPERIETDKPKKKKRRVRL